MPIAGTADSIGKLLLSLFERTILDSHAAEVLYKNADLEEVANSDQRLTSSDPSRGRDSICCISMISIPSTLRVRIDGLCWYI